MGRDGEPCVSTGSRSPGSTIAELPGPEHAFWADDRANYTGELLAVGGQTTPCTDSFGRGMARLKDA